MVVSMEFIWLIESVDVIYGNVVMVLMIVLVGIMVVVNFCCIFSFLVCVGSFFYIKR